MFKPIGKCINCGHLHSTCKNTRESFFDCHVKQRWYWTKKSFSTRTAFPAGSWCGNLPGIGWHCFWISFSFPCTEVAQPEDAFPMKWMRMGDSFCCCFIEGCPLYDSTVWSDSLCLISQLWSDSTVTDVALKHWFVTYDFIPARFDISFIILSSVVVTRGAL